VALRRPVSRALPHVYYINTCFLLLLKNPIEIRGENIYGLRLQTQAISMNTAKFTCHAGCQVIATGHDDQVRPSMEINEDKRADNSDQRQKRGAERQI
jgi:hypothetical protein